MGVGRCQEIQQDKRCGGPGFLGGIQSAVPATHRKPDTAGSVSPLSPGIGLGPSSPEPGLTRGEKVADRGSLSTLTGPRSRSCQPLWDTGSSWTSPAMCVWVERCLSPSCHGRPRFYTGHSLQCPDGDPRASLTSRPGWGLGGQSRLWLPAGGWAECVSLSASQRNLEASLDIPSLCHHAYLVFVMT